MTDQQPDDKRGPVSVLDTTDDADMEDTGCPFHDTERLALQPMIKRNGGVYIIQDPFRVYLCELCLADIGERFNERSEAKRTWFQSILAEIFQLWDRDKSPGDWFRYVGEYEEMEGESDGDYIAFTTREGSE